MRHSNYVPNDGYTEPGFIAAKPGLHEDLRFKFRPILPEAQRKWTSTQSKLRPDAMDRNIGALIAARVTEWDFRNEKGDVLPITAANCVGHMKTELFYRIYGIVLGTDASDIDPQWDDSEKSETAELEAAAVLKDLTIGQAREDRDAKNSGTG